MEVALKLTDQEGVIHEDTVDLLPVEVESMDRYLSGSISESLIDSFGGEAKFGLVFRNPTSGETYSFDKLSEAHIYDDPFGATDEDEDEFLSNSEIAAWADGPTSASEKLTQDVVFYRKDGKLHFRTLFDQAGDIEIGLIKDGEEIGKVDWTLTPDTEIADLLETVDSILSGNHDDDGGVILAAMNAGVNGEDLEVMRAVAASAQSSGGGFSGFLRRNLTIKVNIPTWEAMRDNFENGVRKAGAAVDRAITVATFAGKGFCEGAWFAVKDDAASLVELGKMILNPAETAKTFYEGFKVLIDLDLQGWKNVGKTLVESFLKTGERRCRRMDRTQCARRGFLPRRFHSRLYNRADRSHLCDGGHTQGGKHRGEDRKIHPRCVQGTEDSSCDRDPTSENPLPERPEGEELHLPEIQPGCRGHRRRESPQAHGS